MFSLLSEGGSQFVRPATDCRQRIGLARFQLDAEVIALLAQGFKAFLRQALERGSLLLEGSESLADLVAQAVHLPPAGFTEFIESRETGHELVQLVLGGMPGIANLACYISRGIGDDRQLVAQTVHIAKGGSADFADGIHLLAIVANQRLQAVGMLRQALAGDAPQRFQVTRL